MGLGMLKPGAFMRMLYRLEKFAYNRSARISGISAGMLAAFERKGVPANKRIYFPNGVVFGAAPPACGAFRRRHGIREKDFLAVYSGNLGVKQGLEILIDAAARAKDRRLQIVICGDGAMRPRLEERVRDLQLANVRLLALQPEEHYIEMLADADVTLVTQQAGSGEFFFPSKLLRNLAIGKAVITVADGSSDLARAVRENEFGLNAAPGEDRKSTRLNSSH